MSDKSNLTVATMGIAIGKNSFHVVGLDRHGAIVLLSSHRCHLPRGLQHPRFSGALCISIEHLSLAGSGDALFRSGAAQAVQLVDCFCSR
jgi:hypothetical protein